MLCYAMRPCTNMDRVLPLHPHGSILRLARASIYPSHLSITPLINQSTHPPNLHTGNIVALWWSFYLSRSNSRGGGPASSLVLARKVY